MRTRYFALIYGLGFLLLGILGFVPGLLTPTFSRRAAIGRRFLLRQSLRPVPGQCSA